MYSVFELLNVRFYWREFHILNALGINYLQALKVGQKYIEIYGCVVKIIFFIVPIDCCLFRACELCIVHTILQFLFQNWIISYMKAFRIYDIYIYPFNYSFLFNNGTVYFAIPSIPCNEKYFFSILCVCIICNCFVLHSSINAHNEKS